VDGTQTQTSTTLLQDVAGGQNEAACARFVARYGPMVIAIAAACGLSPEDREDVRQEVMLAAIQTLRKERYDRAQGQFKAWLKGIIYHKIEHARREERARRHRNMGVAARRELGIAPGDLRDVPDPHPSPAEQYEAEFETEWQKVAMEEALDEIRHEVDPLTFQAFDLYARKDRPVAEVAKLLGLSRNAVYIAKTRVLARLREKLAWSGP
jgi:RNA polymerase sigma-70 factor (ECF subfamily)